MHHRAVPLVHADTAFEQRPVTRARERLDQRNIGGTWHQKPNVDAVPCGGPQRFDVRSGPPVIGIAQPQRLARHRRHQLIHPQQSGRIRNGRHHTQRNVASMPGLATRNGIATGGGAKTAWFKDTEGNILAISQRL